MINYVIYNSSGTIVQQGEGTSEQVSKLQNNNQGYGVLILKDKLDGVNEYRVENQQLVPIQSEPIADYMFCRFHEFDFVGNQLDLLYKDIQAGLFGESAKTGQFANYISSIKQQYPKP
jgi:hypothetical protein